MPALGLARLRDMLAAADEIAECYRVLEKGGLNIVGEVLREQGTFFENEHYPKGDVFDPETHAQYYYHAHRDGGVEHGHFHTFLRAGALPSGMRAAERPDGSRPPMDESAITHLVAVSMDPRGFPIGLFAVNRWVTDESWFAAADVIEVLDAFAIDHAYPSWPTNRWLGAMLRLFRPQVKALLVERDRVLASWARARPDVDAYEDRDLEITGFVPVSVDAQRAAVEAALRARGAMGPADDDAEIRRSGP